MKLAVAVFICTLVQFSISTSEVKDLDVGELTPSRSARTVGETATATAGIFNSALMTSGGFTMMTAGGFEKEENLGEKTASGESAGCADKTTRYKPCSRYVGRFCQYQKSNRRRGSVRRRNWGGDAKDNCMKTCGMCPPTPAPTASDTQQAVKFDPPFWPLPASSGCPEGRYKKTGSGDCNGWCHHKCHTCVETAKKDPGPGEDGQGVGWTGNNGRSCLTCKVSKTTPWAAFGTSPIDNSPISQPISQPVTGECTVTGTKNMMKCTPPPMFAPDSTRYACVKTGIKYSLLMHPDFYTAEKPNCGNWWIAKCGMDKQIRCKRNTTTKKLKCKVKKNVKCLQACQGYMVAPGYGCNHQYPVALAAGDLSSAFTRSGKVCYDNCVKPDGSNIVAHGYYPGKNTGGKATAPTAFCEMEAMGY